MAPFPAKAGVVCSMPKNLNSRKVRLLAALCFLQCAGELVPGVYISSHVSHAGLFSIPAEKLALADFQPGMHYSVGVSSTRHFPLKHLSCCEIKQLQTVTFLAFVGRGDYVVRALCLILHSKVDRISVPEEFAVNCSDFIFHNNHPRSNHIWREAYAHPGRLQSYAQDHQNTA